MSQFKIDSSNEIKRLLKLNNIYFLLFKFSQSAVLKLSMEKASGFTLGFIYPHPRRKSYYIATLISNYPKSKGLNFNRLSIMFQILNYKKLSPNINLENGLSIDSFEKQHNIIIGRPNFNK